MLATAKEAPGRTSLTLPGSPGRFRAVDGMRALAALYVVLHHAYLTVWTPEYNRYPHGSLVYAVGWLAYGHFAVSAFIVISGFSLAIPMARNAGVVPGTYLQWFKRRIRRIFPPYYCALGLSLLLIWLWIGTKTGTHWDIALPVQPANVLIHVMLYQDWFDDATINHVMWSVALEWHIYLLFPLLAWTWRRIGPLRTAGSALALSMTADLGMQLAGIRLHGVLPQYIGLFALGMLAAGIVSAPASHPWARVRDQGPWMVILTAGFIFMALYCWRGLLSDFADADLGIGVATMALLIIGSRPASSPIKRLLSWPPLVFIGACSYSLYLIHAPLRQIIWQYAIQPLHLGAVPTFACLSLIGTPLVVAAAYLFYLACERRFQKASPLQGIPTSQSATEIAPAMAGRSGT